MEGAVPRVGKEIRKEIAKQALVAQLAQGLAAGVTVVTPNRRLALALAREVGDRQVASGRGVWEAPDILPFGAFVERLWSDAAFSERGAALPALLSAPQEQTLWETILLESPLAKDLLSTRAAAAQCRDAWQLLHSWALRRKLEGAALYEDARAFVAWLARYEKATRGRNCTDNARLPDVIRPLLAKSAVRLPASVVAFGFDLVTPQQAAFLDALAAAGVPVATSGPARLGSNQARLAFASARDEIAACARWARARLESGATRIGIVVPDLARSRSAVARALAGVLVPERTLAGSPRVALPFEISLGLPLDQQPVVRDALLLLRLAGLELEIEPVSRLVRSPFIAGSRSEQSARACADVDVRRHATAVLTLTSLRRLLDATHRAVPVLKARLSRLAAFQRDVALGSRAPSAWAHAFTNALEIAGFPGERALDSAEYQAVAKWHELLGELATLDRVAAKLSYRGACEWLEANAKATLFQPEGTQAPVQVLGVLESAGLEFDHLWVMGLTDEAWPMPERAQSLVPLRLQRGAGVPQSDANLSLEFDRQLTQGWLGAAGEVIVSHARAESDRELFMSPLIASVPESAVEDLALPSYDTLAEAIRRSVRLERIEDRYAPPIEQSAQPAGTSLFRDQSACPFRAFARHRLGARELEGPAPGLDARDRGNLVHAALHHVWRELGDKAQLDALRPPEREALLAAAADAAIAELRERRPDAMGGRFGAIERARLVSHVRSWLALEARRGDFTVVANETKTALVFGGIAVQARLDRMDRLPSGGHVVIDYKTGDAKVSEWLGHRPDEPQLPMYALGSGEKVDAVVFARVKAGDFRFSGLARQDGLLPNVSTVEKSRATKEFRYRDWDDLLAKWRIEIEQIAAAYSAGDANVDPKGGPKTCERCDQQTFCRVAERLPVGATREEDEDG
jgi:ATP-dependent helicase/nuclease subunit B